MISTSRRFAYLHVPKTGGNSINIALLPFSDDRLRTFEHQDGVDRFEVEGPITPHKHAQLREYAARGLDHQSVHVFISVRHPFARAVSWYFSPHRWARRASDGGWYFEEPSWDREQFEASLDHLVPMVDFLRIDGVPRPPDAIIRMETIIADFARVVADLHLPASVSLPHRNKTIAPTALYRAVMADPVARHAVEERFADDMAFFSY